jgi:uncharacterized protein
MASTNALLDAGPLVAYLAKDEAEHEWAVRQFGRFTSIRTCEPVLTEACARLAYYGHDAAQVLDFITEAGLIVDFHVVPSRGRIARLMRKYADQPMDFADACLVVMSEQVSNSVVLTLDSDFKVYRRHDREIIPLLSPKS